MKLYVIPTPIGNLKDITLRALETLKMVDIILCEDTRTSATLLNHYEIKKKLISFHQHNEHRLTPKIIELLKTNHTAIITDAGTPGISDPCYLLVRACITNNIEIECLPGATAFVPALVKSGIPNNKFIFEGFLPLKKGRQTILKELATEKRTTIIYESPKRILKTLEDLLEFFNPERQVCICREISKLHENFIRGSIVKIIAQLKIKEVKGEIVLIIEGIKK